MTGGVAVILGQTGRNFGAGMSGGQAFVLDETGDFKTKRCNHQIVITEALETTEDIELVKSMIQKHVDYTNSNKAKEILDNFDKYQDKFVKVISPAYKEVLLKRAAKALAV